MTVDRVTLYERDPSQFPTNHAAEMGTDPAIQRANDAGNVPPDTPEEPTLREELTDGRHLCLAALSKVARLRHQLRVLRVGNHTGSFVRDICAEMLVTADTLETDLSALHGSVCCASQIAEHVEVRHG